VVSIDATTSRLGCWDAAKALQDRFLEALPGQYEIALAVYHNDVDTFTPFMSNRRKLRRIAAGIDCNGVRECLPEVLACVATIKDVAAVINITDASAECERVACEHAETLRAHGTQVFVLLDSSYGGVAGYTPAIPAIFEWIAAHTGGAVLPFDASALPKLLRYLNGSNIGACRYEF